MWLVLQLVSGGGIHVLVVLGSLVSRFLMVLAGSVKPTSRSRDRFVFAGFQHGGSGDTKTAAGWTTAIGSTCRVMAPTEGRLPSLPSLCSRALAALVAWTFWKSCSRSRAIAMLASSRGAVQTRSPRRLASSAIVAPMMMISLGAHQPRNLPRWSSHALVVRPINDGLLLVGPSLRPSAA